MSFQQGLSGLKAASTSLDVIGHNIANANTTGMKQSRAEFAELYASNLGSSGGLTTGIGVEVGAVSQQFTQGNISITGNSLDVAINGNGFFQVELPNGNVAYSRDGAFKLNADGEIITNTGAHLLGVPADDTGAVLAGGTVGPMVLPTGGAIPAKVSTEATFSFNLDARADIATGTIGPPSTLVPALETYGTSMDMYDQQGVSIPVAFYFTKSADNTWDVYSSIDGADPESRGQLTFDINGLAITPSTLTNVSLPDPVGGTFDVTLNMDKATQFGAKFGVSDVHQDGQTSGKLTGITIDDSGVIQGQYSNGKQLAAGQIQLVTFTNVQGLAPIGSNYWMRTPSSGDPSSKGPPGTGNLGAVRSGALEDSNVDLTSELVNMMTAQRAYQANAQTIKTQDQVMQTLVNLR